MIWGAPLSYCVFECFCWAMRIHRATHCKVSTMRGPVKQPASRDWKKGVTSKSNLYIL